jgi:glycosyltransferase 2 family protein
LGNFPVCRTVETDNQIFQRMDRSVLTDSSTLARGSSDQSAYWWWLRRVVIGGLICLAAFLLYRTLSRYDFAELVDAVLSVPRSHFLTAIGWAAASYLCLTGFDWLALRYVGARLPYRKVALASFVSLSMGHNIGFAGLSSGAIRYRFYSREGLSGADVAKLVVFCGVTVALGLFVLAGLAILVRPDQAEMILRLDKSLLMVVAGICLAVPAVYVGLAWTLRREFTFRGLSFEMPSVGLALAQTGLGLANFACVAACLHQILTASVEVSYVATASAYVLANAATMVSHVPGGLGVIESVVTHLLSKGGVLPLVLVFRFVYFLIPLAIGGTLFAISEFWMGREAGDESKS